MSKTSGMSVFSRWQKIVALGLAIIIVVFFLLRNNVNEADTETDSLVMGMPIAEGSEQEALEQGLPDSVPSSIIAQIDTLSNNAITDSQVVEPSLETGLETKPNEFHEDSLNDKDKEVIKGKTGFIETKPKQSTEVYSWKSDKLRCKMTQDPVLELILRVEVLYSEKELSGELEKRRRDIQLVITNTVGKLSKKELQAPSLRESLKEALNEYLQTKWVKDIIFMDFKLEIKNSDYQ